MQVIIANIFISAVHIPDAGLLTVTKVSVTDDLKIAKVYISFYNNKKTDKELMQLIINKRKLIRYYLGRKISLRYIPELRFNYDDTAEQSDNINKLMSKIKS